MRRIVIAFLFLMLTLPLFADDFSEMSTQELIEIMGYVQKKNLNRFNKELKSRVPTMNEKEKAKYKENLKKLKK
ncbi:DUF1104 domain-containing protein [Halarcobacter anaerophilus]|jgi:hypothetical protein|uniref:DUF1104 domain-containing protein n=1 Tax=Halarcobacter anaerophilus TaxID=877500 RepID=A0A4Q0Y2Z8_9BACT|nr:DUF1104 domain-containing protein [Halarcobacter anaerophilus]QDF29197.1 hypothetical protein AANAER_1722 [Halarcobacter anaerophilus]RXJ64452.1 DUF1104 domain-containing protein [Halarcobacter anaerophilus]